MRSFCLGLNELLTVIEMMKKSKGVYRYRQIYICLIPYHLESMDSEKHVSDFRQ